MPDIGIERKRPSTGLEDARSFLERAPPIRHVMQDAAERDDVEASGVERQIGRIAL